MRRTVARILDILIFLVIILLTTGCVYYIESVPIRIIIILMLVLAGAWVVYIELSSVRSQKVLYGPNVRTIALLGDRQKIIRSWDLTGKAGFIIGKGTNDIAADIDLSDSAYSAFLDEAHAVVNYTASGWWIEDLSSKNGTSLTRRGKSLLLARGAPAQLQPGDIIVLAEHTRLIVQ